MAESAKPASASERNDRKRLNYLRERFKEVRNEMQAIRSETADLRQKLGIGGKGEAGGEGDAKTGGTAKKKKTTASHDD